VITSDLVLLEIIEKDRRIKQKSHYKIGGMQNKIIEKATLDRWDSRKSYTGCKNKIIALP
jgi:hypothetical protein